MTITVADLEKKKAQVELIRVKAARAELELRIMICEEEIVRLHDAIEKQIMREKELEIKS